MTDPTSQTIETIKADLTPREKAMLAKRTNAGLDLAGACQSMVNSTVLSTADVAAILSQLKSLQACFDALVDLILDQRLVVAVRDNSVPPEAPDTEAYHAANFAVSVLSRATYLEVGALKMEQEASNLRKRLLSAGVAQAMKQPKNRAEVQPWPIREATGPRQG